VLLSPESILGTVQAQAHQRMVASPSTAWAITAEVNEGVNCHSFTATVNNFLIVLDRFIAVVYSLIAFQCSVGKIGMGRKQKRKPSIQREEIANAHNAINSKVKVTEQSSREESPVLILQLIIFSQAKHCLDRKAYMSYNVIPMLYNLKVFSQAKHWEKIISC
jgi:hypothetical protein